MSQLIPEPIAMKTDNQSIKKEYTSKTCGKCGYIHWNLGFNEIFYCPIFNCESIMDIDINAPRNILLLFLTKYNPASKAGMGSESKF